MKKITVRKVVYFVVLIALMVILSETAKLILSTDQRLPIWLDAIVFVIAMFATEVLDKKWIKSQLWGETDEAK